MKKTPRFWLLCSLLAVFVLLAGNFGFGATPVVAGVDVPAAVTMEQDQEAKAILMKMANFLAKAPAFSVTLRSSYDAIQADGQTIEFGEKRVVLLQRPDRLRVEHERSDGEQGLLLFDGRQIIAFNANDNVYTRIVKTGTVDDILVYLVRDMQMTLPLARMLHTGFPQQLESRITAIIYVEENSLFDVATDHLAIRSEDVDMQLWVAQGDRPLPRRVILTYKNAPGQPQFRADLTEWSLSPAVAAASFTFTPPADAEQIPSLAPVRQKGSIPMQKGGAQ